MSSATEFMQAAVRKSLTGAAVGAGVGAGVGILVQIAASKKARRQEQEEENDQSKQENSSVASNKKDREKSEKEMYPDLYAESEVYWLVECLKEFRSQLPESFDNLMLGLDRFCALRVLVHTAPRMSLVRMDADRAPPCRRHTRFAQRTRSCDK